MPNYQKHLVGGCAVFAVMMYANTKLKILPNLPSLQLQALAACLIGSLFPDIDTKSKIQKLIYFTILIIATNLLMTGQQFWACVLVMGSLLPLIASHRGLFHRLWFVVMCIGIGNLMCYLNQPVWVNNCLSLSVFFIAGVISHLWLDLGWRRILG